MLSDRIFAAFETLVVDAQRHMARAQVIETNDADDVFVRICISGFIENATVDDWGRDTYRFVCDARDGEFRDEVLHEYFASDWRAMGLFHCLVLGYNLGLLVAQAIDKNEFTAYELAVYPFRDMNYDRIVKAFGY